MKLPELKSGAVQRLALPDAGVAAAAGQAARSAFQAVGQLAERQYKEQGAAQLVSAEAQLKEGLVDAHLKLSAPVIAVDDPILADIPYDPAVVRTGEDGIEYVQTSAVQALILERSQEQLYQDVRGTVTNTLAAEELAMRWEGMRATSSATGAKQADKNLKAFNLGEYMRSYDSAMNRQDHAAAKEILFAAYTTGTIGQANYDKLRQEHGVKVQGAEVAEVMASGDLDKIEALADDIALSNENYTGPLSGPTRFKLAEQMYDHIERAEEEAMTEAADDELNRLNSYLIDEPEGLAEVQALELEVEALRSDDYEGPITDNKQRAVMAKALEAQVAKSNLSTAAGIEQEQAQAVSDLDLSIKSATGTGTQLDIEAAFNTGIISGAKRTELTLQLEDKTIKQQRSAALGIQIAVATKNGYALDPKNKDVREAIDLSYITRVQNGEDPEAVGLDIMRTSKIMPDTVKGIIRGANRSDAAGLAHAAGLYRQGTLAAPQSMQDLSAGEVPLISSIAANLDLGMAPNDAVESALAWEAMPEGTKEARLAQVSLGKENNQAVLSELIGEAAAYDIPWSTTELDATVGMGARMDVLTAKYLPIAGSYENAQRMAFSDIRKTWALTDINGDYEYMPYAPPGNPVAIKQDISNVYGSEAVIVSDTTTELQVLAGETPSYAVFKRQHTPDPLPREGWQDEFLKQFGTSAEDIGITLRTEADRFLKDTFTIGPHQMSRYTWDDAQALDREADRYMTEARTVRDKGQAYDDRVLDAKIKRQASRGVPYAEKTTYLGSEEGGISMARTISNMVATGDIDEGVAESARARATPEVGF